MKICYFFVNNFFVKKERNLLIVFCVLLLYFALILIFSSEVRQNWLALAIFFLAIYMLFKSYFFRSDSSTFLTILLFGLVFVLRYEMIVTYSTFQLMTMIAMIVSFAFFVDYLIFGNIFCFWTFFANFLTNLPILLYAFNCINLLLMILFLSGEIMLLAITFVLRKYGKI